MSAQPQRQWQDASVAAGRDIVAQWNMRKDVSFNFSVRKILKKWRQNSVEKWLGAAAPYTRIAPRTKAMIVRAAF
jgi:hypothetical protein